MMNNREVEGYISVEVGVWEDLLEVIICSDCDDEVVYKIRWGIENSCTLNDVLKVLKVNKLKLEGISKEDDDYYTMSFGIGEKVELIKDVNIRKYIPFIIPR